MNQTKCPNFGLMISAALLGTLTGCVSHVDQPQARGGYYQAPASREEVYGQPPAVPIEAFDGSAEVVIRVDSDFYEPLTPYGRWEVVGSNGRCWIPDSLLAGAGCAGRQ